MFRYLALTGYAVTGETQYVYSVYTCHIEAHYYYYYYYYYYLSVSYHRLFLPGCSLEPAVTPTAQASSFTLQCFPYYV
jgi:hypothetical protein